MKLHLSINRNTISNMILISTVSIIYLVPISSGFETIDNHYNVYTYSRLLLLPISAWAILFSGRIHLYYFIYLLILLLKFLFVGGNIAGMAFLLSVYMCIDYLLREENQIYAYENKPIKIMFCVASFTFMIQIVVCSYLNRNISSFVGDRNYLGYFVYLIYIYSFYSHSKIQALWIVIGFLTLSRNFALSIVIFFVLNLYVNLFKKKTASSTITGALWVLGQLTIIPLSFIYCNIYESSVVEYVPGAEFRHIITFLDYSNYLRFKVNVLAITSLSIPEFILGVPRGTFAGFALRENLYPHNIFLSITVQMGAFASLIYAMQLLRIMKKFQSYKFLPFWLSIIPYQIFLGPSSFYGIELILVFAILKAVDEKEIALWNIWM